MKTDCMNRGGHDYECPEVAVFKILAQQDVMTTSPSISAGGEQPDNEY